MYLLYKDESFISYGDCPGTERSITFLKPIAIFSSKKKLDSYMEAKRFTRSIYHYLDMAGIQTDPL